eukprot:s2122_g2.t1
MCLLVRTQLLASAQTAEGDVRLGRLPNVHPTHSWKGIQARQRQREHERASSSHQRQAHEPQHFRIHTDEGQEDQREPDDDRPWRGEEDQCAWDGWQNDQWEDEDNWSWQDYDEDDWTYEPGTQEQKAPRQHRKDSAESAQRQPPSPPSKRSRSTQVTAGLEAYMQENQGSQDSAPAVGTSRNLTHSIPAGRVHYQDAQRLSQRRGNGCMGRVGNWNLALVGSLMCPFLRTKYNNSKKLGDFHGELHRQPGTKATTSRLVPQYAEMVQLTTDMVGAYSQPVYDSLPWTTNPAELIHAIRTSEMDKTPTPGEVGDPGLSQLLQGDPVPRTPPPEA